MVYAHPSRQLWMPWSGALGRQGWRRYFITWRTTYIVLGPPGSGIPLALVREKGCTDCHPTDCPFSLGCPSLWVGWHSAELWCSLKQNLHPARCLALHSLKSATSIPMTSCSPQCGHLIQLLTHAHCPSAHARGCTDCSLY